jgi:hypothetical protein
MLELLPLALVRAATRSGEREQQIFRSSLTTPTLSFFCLFVCSLSLSFSISLSLSLSLSPSLSHPFLLFFSPLFMRHLLWVGLETRLCGDLFRVIPIHRNKKNSKSQISVLNCFPLTAEQD